MRRMIHILPFVIGAVALSAPALAAPKLDCGYSLESLICHEDGHCTINPAETRVEDLAPIEMRPGTQDDHLAKLDTKATFAGEKFEMSALTYCRTPLEGMDFRGFRMNLKLHNLDSGWHVEDYRGFDECRSKRCMLSLTMNRVEPRSDGARNSRRIAFQCSLVQD